MVKVTADDRLARSTFDLFAFGVLIRCTVPRGRRAFVAIEVKYTEASGGVAKAHSVCKGDIAFFVTLCP